jgi:hypothetical protein
LPGLWGLAKESGKDSRARLERRTAGGESPVGEIRVGDLARYPSRPGHEEPWSNLGGPSSKAKYELVTDSGEYREGKVKRTPDGE